MGQLQRSWAKRLPVVDPLRLQYYYATDLPNSGHITSKYDGVPDCRIAQQSLSWRN